MQGFGPFIVCALLSVASLLGIFPVEMATLSGTASSTKTWERLVHWHGFEDDTKDSTILLEALSFRLGLSICACENLVCKCGQWKAGSDKCSDTGCQGQHLHQVVMGKQQVGSVT